MRTSLHSTAGLGAKLGLGLVACLLAALAGCSGERARGAPRAGAADRDPASQAGGNPGVGGPALDVMVVASGLDASDVLTTFLEPAVDAPAVARHRSIVRSVAVVEGQRVTAGQPLAQLEDDLYRLELERALALADQARAEYERSQKASAGNLISQHELEVARAKYHAAQADAARARLDHEHCTVRSPIAGVVRLARARPDALVEEDEILFRVAVTDRLRADLYLPATLRHRFTAGDAVRVVSSSDPSSPPGEGRVRLVNPVVDPVTGLFHVEIEVRAGPGLAAGEDVQIVPAGPAAGRTTGSRLGGAVLPRGTYVEREGDRLVVYKVVDGRARRTPVELGGDGADGFSVLSGLQPGDLIMAAGQTPPRDGTPVAARVVSGR